VRIDNSSIEARLRGSARFNNLPCRKGQKRNSAAEGDPVLERKKGLKSGRNAGRGPSWRSSRRRAHILYGNPNTLGSPINIGRGGGKAVEPELSCLHLRRLNREMPGKMHIPAAISGSHNAEIKVRKRKEGGHNETVRRLSRAASFKRERNGSKKD